MRTIAANWVTFLDVKNTCVKMAAMSHIGRYAVLQHQQCAREATAFEVVISSECIGPDLMLNIFDEHYRQKVMVLAFLLCQKYLLARWLLVNCIIFLNRCKTNWLLLLHFHFRWPINCLLGGLHCLHWSGRERTSCNIEIADCHTS